jgi:hypothetical protein
MNTLNTNKLIAKFIFVFLFFSTGVLAGGTDENETTGSTKLAPLVEHLSGLFLEGKLTVKGLEEALSTTADQAENKEYWSVDSDKFDVRSTVKASDKNSVLEELTLYTNGLRQLELKDLEKMFGNSRVIIRSRDPWVEFVGKKRQDGKNVSITAKLYAPPEAEISPVTTFELSLE